MSRQELSVLSGVDPSSIYGYEKKGACPSFDNAIALATALGVSLKRLTDAKD